ncbi:hypothetical protein [Sphingopyxis sp.]|uniref:hypothetical protein n=1 Tax=Sphingopyxis sp. TaxID=1908224 RepID=UPI003D6D7C82
MNKFTSAIAALAMIGSGLASGTAMAQSGTYTGTAAVFKGIALNCVVSADFDPLTSTVVLSITAPEPNCGLLSIISNPHTYSVSGSTITVDDVNVNTITGGGCFDDLIATYDSVNDTVSVDDELTERDGGGNCFITSDGPLTLTP